MNTEKALNHSGQGLFGLYRMSWSFQVAERVEFRFNHPNSLNFIPAWLCSLHRPYPKNGGLASLPNSTASSKKLLRNMKRNTRTHRVLLVFRLIRFLTDDFEYGNGNSDPCRPVHMFLLFYLVMKRDKRHWRAVPQSHSTVFRDTAASSSKVQGGTVAGRERNSCRLGKDDGV